MTVTKIEAYIFGGNRAHFVKRFDFADGQTAVTFVPVDALSGDLSDVTAIFHNAVMTNTWKDPNEGTVWPLDIIGFDSFLCDRGWRFVLTCDTVEWIWESTWPVLSTSLSVQQ